MEAIASVLIVSGSLLALLAAIGLQRFDDVFARMHAATKPATFGLLLTLTGAALVLPIPGGVAKLFLVVLLQFTTAPVAAHLVSRAALRTGRELNPDTILDEESAELVAEYRSEDISW
jgi:multicomponent Na+:H+ antiporter subunit G